MCSLMRMGGPHLKNKARIRASKDDEDAFSSFIFLNIDSMEATAGPPIGPILGQYGIPAAPFCTEFNERSEIFSDYLRLAVTVYVYQSGDYFFDLSLPKTAFFFKRIFDLDYFERTPLHWIPFIRRKWLFVGIPKDRKRRYVRSARNGYLTVAMVYEVMKHREQYEIFKIQETASYVRGVCTIETMGLVYTDLE